MADAKRISVLVIEVFPPPSRAMKETYSRAEICDPNGYHMSSDSGSGEQMLSIPPASVVVLMAGSKKPASSRQCRLAL